MQTNTTFPVDEGLPLHSVSFSGGERDRQSTLLNCRPKHGKSNSNASD